jgi:ABC-2 type transport system permease protein
MRAFGVLYKRELSAFFLSPIAYIFAIVTLGVLGWNFLWVLGMLMRNGGEVGQQQLSELFFGGNVFFWMYLIMLVTALTMRLFAEEKRAGTIEALLTAPVSDIQVVLAKYLGALTFYCVLWAPTVLYYALLGPRHLDWGILGSAYLGTFLLGALFIAIGCLVSALCTNQFVSAIVCAAILMGVSFGPLLASGSTLEVEWVRASIRYLNLLGEGSLAGDCNRGLVTVAHLVYPLSLTAVSLFLTCKVLASRAWK